MSRSAIGWIAIFSLVALGCAAAVAGGDEPAAGTAASSPPPIHPEPGLAMERLIACTRAAVREDREALLEALDGIEEVCRNIYDPEDERYSSRMIEFDWAFHRTLEMARKLTAEGDMAKGFEQYQWVERGCRLCHVQAAKEGLYSPAMTTPPDPAPSGTTPGPGR